MGSDDVASIIGMMFVAPFIAYILYLILNYLAKTPLGPYVNVGKTIIHALLLILLGLLIVLIAFLIAYLIMAMVTRVRRGAQW